MKGTALLVLRALDTALMIGEFSVAARASLEESAAVFRTMVREGREPTPAEWSQANAASDRMLEALAMRAAEQ
jgi:hypothetical protein